MEAGGAILGPPVDAARGIAIAIAAIAAALASAWVTGRLVRALAARNILDRPNRRSLHASPVPRGGGIAVVAVVLAAWTAIGALAPAQGLHIAVVIQVAVALALVSWQDDRRGLPVALRLGVQAAAVASVLAVAPWAGRVFGGWLPVWLDAVLVAGLWLWFVNLFNFMDGIDGLAGGEAASVGAGAALVAALSGFWPGAAYGAVLAGSALGFLRHNWPPARIFMGDVGSVPLGFLLGWLLIETAAAGAWVAALILPAYFVADATATLARRLLRGEKIWEAHKTHAYQRAVAAGRSHAQVTSAVLAANGALAICAAASVLGYAVPALVAAAAVLAGLFWHLLRR